jgi:putative ABC transport system substrate-binding protein
VPLTAAELELMHMAALRELGWIEGQNLLFERRYAYDRPELLQTYAEELVRLKVDLIMAEGTDAALAAKGATKTIPIVIRNVSDPVRTGIVARLSRPGGNITGYATFGLDSDLKTVTLLRELLPNRTVARLDTSTNLGYRAIRGELEQGYRSLGLDPLFVEVSRPDELDNAISEIARRRAQALVVGGANMMYDNRVAIVRTALQYALPAVGGKVHLDAGAVMSHQPNYAELRLRVAAFIDRILRGANPADLPIERPTRFEVGLNLRTAKALGVVIPQSMLLRADYVIE